MTYVDFQPAKVSRSPRQIDRETRVDLSAVTLILPALNEEQALPHVLTALPAVGRVIVVDNGSTDRTAEVAAAHGVDVVSEPQRGYGSACQRGLAAIIQTEANGDGAPQVVAFLDADFSDSPELLPRLVEPILNGNADLTIGSRVIGEREAGAMPAHSLWGTRFACWLVRMRYGIPCTDLGPFRAVRWSSLRVLGMCDCDFGWTIEMQVKAARAGLRIVEFPVPYRERVGQSKISGTIWGSIRASVKILWMLAKHVVFVGDIRTKPSPEEHAVPPGA